MTRITTHVLDTVRGSPAGGVAIFIEKQEGEGWTEVWRTETDKDGRCLDLVPAATDGLYRLTFQTGAYLAGLNRRSIYPEISVTFRCAGEAHYHLPLLISENSYTTYRGS